MELFRMFGRVFRLLSGNVPLAGNETGTPESVYGWADGPAEKSRFNALCQATDTVQSVSFVPPFIPYLFSSYGDAAAERIHRLIRDLNAQDLLELYTLMRDSYGDYLPLNQAYHKITVSDFQALSLPKASGIAVWSVGSLHRDGYIREYCVEQLIQTGSPDALPYLLVRSLDWVAPIRHKAMAAVERFVIPEFAARFIDNATWVIRVAESSREDYSRLVSAIQALLTDTCPSVLTEGCLHPDRAIRLYCLRLATGHPQVDLWPQREALLRHPDPSTRLAAVRKFRTDLNGEKLKSFLADIHHDSVMSIRRESLYGTLEHFPAEATSELQEALMDTHQSIRELARYHLKQQTPPPDFAEAYRQAVTASQASPHRLAIALAGLGETGSSSNLADLEMVSRFATHPRAKIRQASLQAQLKLQERSQAFTTAWNALSDSSGKVVRVAFLYLREKAKQIDLAVAWALFRDTPHVHTRRLVFALITRHPELRPVYSRYILMFRAHQHRFIETAALPEISVPPGVEQALSAYEQSLLSSGLAESDFRVGFVRFLGRCIRRD